jgi:hypothetical protein
MIDPIDSIDRIWTISTTDSSRNQHFEAGEYFLEVFRHFDPSTDHAL